MCNLIYICIYELSNTLWSTRILVFKQQCLIIPAQICYIAKLLLQKWQFILHRKSLWLKHQGANLKFNPRGISDSKSMALVCSSLKDSTISIQIYIGISQNNLLIKCSFKKKKNICTWQKNQMVQKGMRLELAPFLPAPNNLSPEVTSFKCLVYSFRKKIICQQVYT